MTESESKSPLWLFMDTEFANLDQPDLISIGIVSLDRQHEFYGELPELTWYRHASAFTLQRVKPLLTGPVFRDDVELAARLGEWIRAISKRCRMVTDAPGFDWEIVRSLLECDWPPNLQKQPRWLLPTEAEKALYYRETGRPPHHALYDAYALRKAWQRRGGDPPSQPESRGLATHHNL
ncbi:MAG TPA: hypothetical protein VFK24_10405 [Gammaproteobacteria bacterium]|nr:hypothetical protein [Gammaproteobacteria bacterium]